MDMTVNLYKPYFLSSHFFSSQPNKNIFHLSSFSPPTNHISLEKLKYFISPHISISNQTNTYFLLIFSPFLKCLLVFPLINRYLGRFDWVFANEYKNA